MATYGFELEFPNFYFTSSGPIEEAATLFNLTSNDVLQFSIKAVDGRQAETNKSWTYKLKASSTVRTTEADASLFGALTAFLNEVNAKIDNGSGSLSLSPQMQPWKLTDPNHSYIASYKYTKSLQLKKTVSPQSLDNTEVLPQFTFGFDAPKTLVGFYNHFDPVTILDMNRVKQPEKGVFTRNPYSDSSLGLFTSMFQVSVFDNTWFNFWCVLEFLRLSLGFSMAREINQDDTNRQGNKAYMRILSRVSFRSLFQNLIPPKITQPFIEVNEVEGEDDTEKVSPIDYICRYIREGFTLPFQTRIPFWHISNTATLDGKEYMNTNPSLGNPDLAQYYKDKISLEGIVASILQGNWSKQGFPEEFQKAVNILFPIKKPDNIISTINQMVNNMDTYDFLSPVPFSLPNDAMGYYTRANIPGTPKFLLEVKYIERFYDITEKQERCLYTTQFQSFCVNEFNLALKGWNKQGSA